MQQYIIREPGQPAWAWTSSYAVAREEMRAARRAGLHGARIYWVAPSGDYIDVSEEG